MPIRFLVRTSASPLHGSENITEVGMERREIQRKLGWGSTVEHLTSGHHTAATLRIRAQI